MVALSRQETGSPRRLLTAGWNPFSRTNRTSTSGLLANHELHQKNSSLRFAPLPSSYRFSAAGFTIVSGDGGETNGKGCERGRKVFGREKGVFSYRLNTELNWFGKRISVAL